MNNYDPNIKPEMQEPAILAAEQVHRDWLNPQKTKQNYEVIKRFCRSVGFNYDSFLTVMGSYLRPLFEKEPKFRGAELEQKIQEGLASGSDGITLKAISDLSLRKQLDRIYHQS